MLLWEGLDAYASWFPGAALKKKVHAAHKALHEKEDEESEESENSESESKESKEEPDGNDVEEEEEEEEVFGDGHGKEPHVLEKKLTFLQQAVEKKAAAIREHLAGAMSKDEGQ